MKYIYKANLYLTIILLAISLTFWGAIIALPILGVYQIGISVFISRNISKLPKPIKYLFYGYVLLTILLASTFKILNIYGVDVIELLFIWLFVSGFLALFNLHITYKIKNHENSNS